MSLPTVHSPSPARAPLTAHDLCLDEELLVGAAGTSRVALTSGPHRTAGEAAAALAALRAEAGDHLGTELVGAGAPLAPHPGRTLLGDPPLCGLHVRVGMPDPETALVAVSGLRKWVPVLQALGANSAVWEGRDSGLASVRTFLRRALPDAWDLRADPDGRAVELRALDAQAEVEDVAALGALVQGLACHEALTAVGDGPPADVLAEASFLAARDGLDAGLSIGGPTAPVADLARHAVDVARGYVAALGSAEELTGIERILTEGNGAIRQRRAFAAGRYPDASPASA